MQAPGEGVEQIAGRCTEDADASKDTARCTAYRVRDFNGVR